MRNFVTFLVAFLCALQAARVVQGNDPLVVKCSTIGLSDAQAASCLPKLLGVGDSILKDDSSEVFSLTDSDLNVAVSTYTGDTAEPYSDVTLLFFRPVALFNPTSILHTLTEALRSATQSSSKKKLAVVTVGPGSSVMIEEVINKYLQEAWSSLNLDDKGKGVEREEKVSSEVDVSIVHLGSLDANKFKADAAKKVQGIIRSLSLEEARKHSTTIKSTSQKPMKVKTPAGDASPKTLGTAKGVGVCNDAVFFAENWAKKQVIEVSTEIQSQKFMPKFKGYMDDLIDGAVAVLKEQVLLNGGASNEAMTIAVNDLRRRIFALMQPFFKKHVAFVRSEVVDYFNEEVTSDQFILSPQVMEDYNFIRNEAIRRLKSGVKKLTPKHAPKRTSWGGQLDVQIVTQSIDEYVKGKKDEYTVLGILPRDKIPFTLSMHWFVLHPFGKDYRQDVITKNRRDKVLYDPTLASLSPADELVPPSLARPMLKQIAGALKGRKRADLDEDARAFKKVASKRNAEFAREMLMFPLSVKSPAVPMVGDGRRRRSGEPPRKDLERKKTGPERFIRWDVAPMDEVKENMEELRRQHDPSNSEPDFNEDGEAGAMGGLQRTGRMVSYYTDRAWDLFPLPYFRRRTYVEPPVDYGARYAPTLSQQRSRAGA